jgi:hypothetical protein
MIADVVPAHDAATDSRKRGPHLALPNGRPRANLSLRRIGSLDKTPRPASKGFHRSTTIRVPSAPLPWLPSFVSARRLSAGRRNGSSNQAVRGPDLLSLPAQGPFLLADCRTGMSSSGLMRRLSIVGAHAL